MKLEDENAQLKASVVETERQLTQTKVDLTQTKGKLTQAWVTKDRWATRIGLLHEMVKEDESVAAKAKRGELDEVNARRDPRRRSMEFIDY